MLALNLRALARVADQQCAHAVRRNSQLQAAVGFSRCLAANTVGAALAPLLVGVVLLLNLLCWGPRR